jgi:ATP-dependent Clp protease ATP-binding subunit ClpA
MSFPVNIPFYAFRLRLLSGTQVIKPMTDPQALRVGDTLSGIAKKYAEEFQEKVLNKGTYKDLLDEYREGDFLKDRLSIGFTAAKDRLSYPAFELEFDFFYTQDGQGLWGVIPSLDLESYAEDYDLLVKRLGAAVRTHFIRKKKLQHVRFIVASIWFDTVELLQDNLQLEMLTPKEIAAQDKDNSVKLLPKVARPLEVTKRVAYGRKKELDQILRGIKNKFSRNIILVGPSGVGKTALIWETARHYQKNRKHKGQIWETTASTLIKELTKQTGWQDNLAYLCQELAKSEDLLFIRNLMELFEVGKYEGNSVSIAEYLRTYISRGEITVLTECTEEELARIELRSPNYLSFFQIIRLEEPKKQLEDIILKKINDMAADQKVKITEEAIKEVLRLNKRFSPYAGMPGKPIRFLESLLINRKNPLRKKKKTSLIGRTEIIEAFCEDSGMPRFMVDPDISMDTQAIRKEFNENVFGQENAVDSLTSVLASVKMALTRTEKPIASFFFVGPTGVGKTELAKVLAEFMFGHRTKLLRFDMSEYSSPYAVMRLIGTDYHSDGVLTSAIRREPFAVLLFDEIEKAHANFYDLLLQILSEGRLTDSQGKLVNFCSTIIIMTSNIGAQKLQNNQIGWKKEVIATEVKDHFMNAIQKYFRPELLNRIDDIIPFEPLDNITIRFIVDREIQLLKKREGIQFRKIHLQIDDQVLDYLGTKGYHSKYGARYLQRTVREELIIPLAHQLNEYEFDDQLIVKVALNASQKIQVEIEADPLGLDLLIEELDMINNADHASNLRRQVIKLMEGALYMRLLSELDILEREKKRLKDKFWENDKSAKKYTYYIQTKERLDKLLEENEEYELNLNLAALNLETYHPETADKLKGWEARFFDFKKEIYSQMTPRANQCHIGIYGVDFSPVLRFYVQLLKSKHFDFSAKAIWFRESYYMEEILVGDGTIQKREEYITTILDPEHIFTFKPESSKDILYGVELAISGPCAYLFLKEETGYQKWMVDKGHRNFYVQVSNEAFHTPTRIHRKDFYNRQNVRRTLETNSVRDTPYRINREMSRDQLVPFMKEKLEERFVVKLQMEVL